MESSVASSRNAHKAKQVVVFLILISTFWSIGTAQAQVDTSSAQLSFPLLQVPNPIPTGIPPPHPERRDKYRVTVGVGGNAGFSSSAFTIAATAAYQYDHSLWSGSFIANNKTSFQLPRENWDSFDLLYGYAISGVDLKDFSVNGDRLFMSLSAGVGMYTHDTRWRRRRGFVPTDTINGIPPSQQVNTFTYGADFPVQLQAAYAPWPFLGFAAMLFLNVNHEQTNYGAVVGIQIGYF